MSDEMKDLPRKEKIRKRQITNLNKARHALLDASNNLNTERNECECCGFGLWKDEPESRIHRSLMSAVKQVEKVRKMMIQDLEDIDELLSR